MANVRSLNRVILVGRVGRDPDITHMPSLSKDVAKFGLATSEGYMDKNNQWQESTEWHNIVAWGPLAKKTERSITKGSLILVEGKIKTSKWQDKTSGQDRRSTEIYVDSLIVLEKSDRNGSAGNRTVNTFNDNKRGNEDQEPPDSLQSPPDYDINSDVSNDENNDPF